MTCDPDNQETLRHHGSRLRKRKMISSENQTNIGQEDEQLLKIMRRVDYQLEKEFNVLKAMIPGLQGKKKLSEVLT